MVAVAEEVGICPYTLEPCEDCCEQKLIKTQKTCPFTMEKCFFD